MIVRSKGGDPSGYIYYYGWQRQAYTVDGESFVPDIDVLVSGTADPRDLTSDQITGKIPFRAGHLGPESDWIQVGALRYRATVLDFALVRGRNSRPYFKMGSLEVKINVEPVGWSAVELTE